MMYLSTYVVDPLTNPIETWSHPLTGAKVQLSAALKSRLPQIMQVDLKKEATSSEEIFHQLLAAELRDLGFLIPADWVDREDECISFYRHPSRGQPGFFGKKPAAFGEITEKTAAIFMTVGGDTQFSGASTGFLERLRFELKTLYLEDEQKSGIEIDFARKELAKSRDFWGSFEDLGHISTDGLSSSQAAHKLRELLSYLPKNPVPFLFTDSPLALFPLMREPRLWNRSAGDQTLQLLVFDQHLRISEDVAPSSLSAHRRPTAENLFVHFEETKSFEFLEDIYIGLPRFASRQLPQEILSQIVHNNHWITHEELVTGHQVPAVSHLIKQSAVAVIHGGVFDKRLPSALSHRAYAILEDVLLSGKLRGVIFWGMSIRDGVDFDHTRLGYACRSMARALHSSPLDERIPS